MIIKCLGTLFLVLLSATTFAQSRHADPGRSYAPGNSLHPGEQVPVKKHEIKKRGLFSSRKKKSDPVQEYYDRMELVAKAYKRAERLSRKPQYSNPLYFGHKRPPKKRPASKMRYCKECGIRH